MGLAGDRIRPWLLLSALLVPLITATPGFSVENRTVERFVRLSQAFHDQLPRSGIAGLSPAAQRARAVCILSRFETGYGPDGVAALMRLMSVLSSGAEFDDPSIVAFNERFGGSYDRIVGECTRASSGS
ncbi:hypothetical protein [Oceanibium sediminis]|uniref:hypothetical protein n=1 Tax=Oceanibium sediminis TaxID=2026339 RepID=UPI000DD2D3A4|nr:hypothetical protein [Oceanibium sediminis]